MAVWCATATIVVGRPAAGKDMPSTGCCSSRDEPSVLPDLNFSWQRPDQSCLLAAVTFVHQNLEFQYAIAVEDVPLGNTSLAAQLAAFKDFGKSTQVVETPSRSYNGQQLSIPTYVNEFWTSKQRAANSLHEVSYRACFKPQLPRFFIQRLTSQGDLVYDPFMGRGTTLIEAGLLGRVPCGCDINPLSVVLSEPRLHPPTMEAITERLRGIDFASVRETPEELLVFYHPETLRELCALKHYLIERKASGRSDYIDDWIRMVAVNRLTGHSPGFFSVYTMPPNQAVSVKRQKLINEKRNQKPPRRHVAAIICKKSRQLLADCDGHVREVLSRIGGTARLLTQHSAVTPKLGTGSVSLVVTSPPFLDVVDYAGDNWLRCWFIGVDPTSVKLTVPKRVEDWQQTMSQVFRELHRVLRRGGHVAFEVGEVRNGKIKLEEAVVPCGIEGGLQPFLIVINAQKFTKTANCWGVDNNVKGTNTNRIVVFRKPG